MEIMNFILIVAIMLTISVFYTKKIRKIKKIPETYISKSCTNTTTSCCSGYTMSNKKCIPDQSSV
jgi:hypothetical protein